MNSVQAATLLGPGRLEVKSYPSPDELEPGMLDHPTQGTGPDVPGGPLDNT